MNNSIHDINDVRFSVNVVVGGKEEHIELLSLKEVLI